VAACLRIQTRNHRRRIPAVREVIRAAKDNGCFLPFGVNAAVVERHLVRKYGEPLAPMRWVNPGSTISAFLQDNDFPTSSDFVQGIGTCSCRGPAYQALADARMLRSNLGITESWWADDRHDPNRPSALATCCGWHRRTRSACRLSAIRFARG